MGVAFFLFPFVLVLFTSFYRVLSIRMLTKKAILDQYFETNSTPTVMWRLEAYAASRYPERSLNKP